MTVLLTFEVSTQVTKSSIDRVTKYAGSLTVLGPTRMWPCSMYFTADETVSAILILHATTASLRLQKPETVTLCSTSDILLARSRRPMSYSLDSS